MAGDPPAGAAGNPEFVSVTYGAGGSTRSAPTALSCVCCRRRHLSPAAHLTCVDAASREDVDAVIQDYWDAGIRHIVALRGDPPGQIGGAYVPRADGYANATELSRRHRRHRPGFEVSVGLYPHIHPESPSVAHDIDVLKAKIDAGATRAITQFFFDVDGFLRFVEQVRKAGITIPISAGIMPVTNFKGLQEAWRRPCGIAASRPGSAHLFEGLDKDPDTRRLIAASVAAEMCARLEEEGFSRTFHFYTLNRADLVYAICRILGVREEKRA